MTARRKPDEYEVGFGKPPKATRFKKGQSGNPKGRPKGSRNYSTLVEEMLNAPVTIRENGKTKTVSTLEAAFKRIMQMAVNGNIKALFRLLELAAEMEIRKQGSDENSGLTNSDQEILERFLQRRQEGDSDA